jgi:type IV pilus assembly protein PilO
MRDMQQMKNKFIAVAVLLVILDAALLAFLLRPGHGEEAQQAQETALHQQLAAAKKDVSLLKKSDPAATRAALNRLYADDVATRLSQISKHIEKLCQDAGVASESIRYSSDKAEKSPLPDVQEEVVETTITGDYIKVARFINAVEQDKLLLLIDKISLSSQQEPGTVSLQISFTAFLREAADKGKART